MIEAPFPRWPIQITRLHRQRQADRLVHTLARLSVCAVPLGGLVLQALVLWATDGPIPIALVVGPLAFWVAVWLVMRTTYPLLCFHIARLDLIHTSYLSSITQMDEILGAILAEHGIHPAPGSSCRVEITADWSHRPPRPALRVDGRPIELCPVQRAAILPLASRGSGSWGLIAPDHPYTPTFSITPPPLSAHQRLHLSRHVRDRTALIGTDTSSRIAP